MGLLASLPDSGMECSTGFITRDWNPRLLDPILDSGKEYALVITAGDWNLRLAIDAL